MALLNAGWWQTTWWPSQWWHETWWPHYGAYAPSVTQPGGQVTVSRVADDLAMLALVLIARRRRKRRMML